MLSVKSNIDEFMKDLDDMAKSQIPYATALALNDVARRVIAAEAEQISQDFPTATAFTKRGFGMLPATKYQPFVTVFVKELQNNYLEPYVDGGSSVPTEGGAMLVPKGIKVNQFGNIPYKKIDNLKNTENVFIGSIKTKSGQRIGGVFERLKGKVRKDGSARRIKILVRFTDPWTLKQHFGFEERANQVAEDTFEDAMEQGMIKAMGSMR
jgi:hypothetical protein